MLVSVRGESASGRRYSIESEACTVLSFRIYTQLPNVIINLAKKKLCWILLDRMCHVVSRTDRDKSGGLTILPLLPRPVTILRGTNGAESAGGNVNA